MKTNAKLISQHLTRIHFHINGIILTCLTVLFLLPWQASTQDIQLSIEPGDTSICAGQSVVLIAEITSTSEIVSYEWSSGQQGVDVIEVSPSASTVYSLTVTDETGATASAQSTVNITFMEVLIDVIGSIACPGDNNAILSALPTGTPPFTYSWSNGATGDINPNLSPGTYFVTVTDASGCTASMSEQITEPSTIDFATTISDASCIGSNSGFILAPAIGGTPPYSYLWSDGFTQADRQNIPAGTYELTATDANNCTATANYEIGNSSTDIAPMIDFEATTITHTGCGSAEGAIDLVVQGGTEPLEFSWFGFPINFSATTEDINGLESGTYTVYIYDDNGCYNNADFEVEDQGGSNMTIDMENSIFRDAGCIGESTGHITLEINGGTPPYSYVWSNGSMVSHASTLSAGDYYATITDAAGCEFIAGPMTISEPDIPFVLDLENSFATDVSCAGASDGSISISFTGGMAPFFYEVSILDVEGNPFLELESLDGLAAGRYDIVLIDANICHLVAGVFTIGQADSLAYDEVNSVFTIDCENPSNNLIAPAFLNAAPPLIYQWSNGSEASTLSNVPAGNYTVTATDACGFTEERTFIISPEGQLITPIQEQICIGSSFTIGNESFTENGEYEVLLTTADGSCDSIVRLSLELLPLPTVDAGDDLSYCEGGDGILAGMVSPGASVSWTPTDFLGDTLSEMPFVDSEVDQMYILSATLNGCINTDTVMVIIDNLLNPIANAGDDAISCGLESIQLGADPTAMPPLDNPTDEIAGIIWKNLNTDQVIDTSPNPNVFPEESTDYLVTVLSESGCQATDTVSVTTSPFIELGAIVSDASCPNANDGHISVTVTGGTPPLDFIWTDDPGGSFTTERTDLTAGAYPLIVTDILGCQSEANPIVSEPLLVWNTVVIQPNCDNPNGGTIDLGLEVDESWNINWSNGVSNVTSQSALPGGDYCVTVSQSEECSFTRCFTIENLVEADCGTITGLLRQDLNEDCISQNGEPKLSGWVIEARSDNAIYHTLTDEEGAYEISLPLETYTLHPQPPGLAWDSCSPPATANLITTADLLFIDLSAPAPVTCSELNVSFNTPFLRRCFTSSYHIHVCNTGSAETGDYTLEFLLDEGLNYVGSSITPSEESGGLLFWERPSLPPNSCYDFAVEVEVDCEAELGQTHCSALYAYNEETPIICAPPNEEWSGANIQVFSFCNNGELSFDVFNNSLFNLNESLSYQILQDTFILQQGQLTSLVSGGATSFSVTSTGATYTFRIQQPSGHPYGNTVITTIEGCGTDENGSFSTGITELIEQQFGNPNSFILCENNIGAYDPNDKIGRPLGIGGENNIFPGTELNYRIRFQNTGTDTAFQVVIRDQLADELDINTFRHGASSHDYTLALREDRTLIFTFDNILLPDSSTNLVESQGFVSFFIKPIADLPLGTEIHNEAAIYFDFNEAIITNRTRHTINDNFLDVISWIPTIPGLELDWNFYPNPSRAMVQLEFKSEDPIQGYQFKAFDAQGRLLHQQQLNTAHLELDVSSWPQGNYLFQLWSDDGQLIGNAQFLRQ